MVDTSGPILDGKGMIEVKKKVKKYGIPTGCDWIEHKIFYVTYHVKNGERNVAYDCFNDNGYIDAIQSETGIHFGLAEEEEEIRNVARKYFERRKWIIRIGVLYFFIVYAYIMSSS